MLQSEDAAPAADIHARAVPISPSYFSREPHFNDCYLRIQDLHRRYGNLPRTPADKVKKVAWKLHRHYRQESGEPVRASHYNRCISLAKELHKIHPSLKPTSVTEAIQEFLRDINPHDNVAKPSIIDKHGRSLGVGRRKTSVARAWVVPGTGEVLVNGKDLSEAFGRVHDRESATWALRATERVGKYNVWALVDGGGTTGQAEAMTLAVAKALLAHEPALKTALRKGMLVLSRTYTHTSPFCSLG